MCNDYYSVLAAMCHVILTNVLVKLAIHFSERSEGRDECVRGETRGQVHRQLIYEGGETGLENYALTREGATH